MLESKRKLKERALNAEQRAGIHYRKLHKIEMILKQAESEKIPAVFIVDKIKETIADQAYSFKIAYVINS